MSKVVYIRDMNVVRDFERKLGRDLEEAEMAGLPFLVEVSHGSLDLWEVPLIEFPDELVPACALNAIEEEKRRHRVFDWDDIIGDYEVEGEYEEAV